MWRKWYSWIWVYRIRPDERIKAVGDTWQHHPLHTKCWINNSSRCHAPLLHVLWILHRTFRALMMEVKWPLKYSGLNWGLCGAVHPTYKDRNPNATNIVHKNETMWVCYSRKRLKNQTSQRGRDRMWDIQHFPCYRVCPLPDKKESSQEHREIGRSP